MLANNKCILAYGLSDEDINKLSTAKFNIKIVTKEMLNMKVNDIVNGIKIETVVFDCPDDKIIVFNNYDEANLQFCVKLVRSIVKGIILAVVTPTSSQWTFKDLSKHLIEERNYFRSKQKER
jgi:hypothetical protein